MDDLRDTLFEIDRSKASARYGLSRINPLQHALQSGALAEARGEPDECVIAALLHDVGHIIHDRGTDSVREGGAIAMRPAPPRGGLAGSATA